MEKFIKILLFCLLPFSVKAQVNGTIQKTVATGTIRGSFGSSGIDTLLTRAQSYAVFMQNKTDTAVAPGAYAAFPGLTTLPNGNLIMLYRLGATHISIDGVIKSKISTDQGKTWSTASTVYSPGGSLDARDPEITLLADGTLLASFLVTPDSEASPIITTAYVIKGTVTGNTVSWGSPINVGGFAHGTGVTSKPIQLTNGNIVLPVWGYENVSGFQSSGVVISSNGGTTWGSIIVTGSATADIQYSEANGVQLASGRIVIMIRRDGNTTPYGYSQVYSDNNGTTWSAATNAISTVSVSRPTVTLLQNGGLFMMGRFATLSKGGYTTSWDGGATFVPFTPMYSTLPSVYNSAVRLANGNLATISALENSSTSTTIMYNDFNDGDYVFSQGNARGQSANYTGNVRGGGLTSFKNTSTIGEATGLTYTMKSSTDDERIYSTIQSVIVDNTNGSEDGKTEVYVIKNGSQTKGATFNENLGLDVVGAITGSNLSGTNTGDQTTITGNAGTATALQNSRTIGTLTGDVTTAGSSFNGTANNTNATILATVNPNVGSFGSATQVPQITVNGKGLITAVSNVTITPTIGSITGLGTGVATALGVNIGTSGSPVVNGGGLGTPSSGVATNLTGTASGLTVGNATTLSSSRTLWGQSFNGSANVSGSLTGVTSIDLFGTASNTATGYTVAGFDAPSTIPTGLRWYDSDDSRQAVIAGDFGGWGLWTSSTGTAIDRSSASPKFYVTTAGQVSINALPTAASGTTDALVRNTSTGNVERYSLVSGTYTPTGTNVTGTSAITARVTKYSRIGDQAHVSGYITVTGGAGANILSMTLPIASDFTLSTDCTGVGNGDNSATLGTIVTTDTTNNLALLSWTGTGASGGNVYFQYDYIIK